MSDVFDFDTLFDDLGSTPQLQNWVDGLRTACSQALASSAHGNLDHWIRCVRSLPVPNESSFDIDDGRVVVGADHKVDDSLREQLMEFHPWRKGPFRLLGHDIDTEWRSDWKWDRLKSHVDFRDRRVLDVGCGNGYFGWRMLAAGARQVMGLDPFLLYVAQHELISRLAGYRHHNYVLPLKDDCLIDDLRAFDVALSMGVLYHRTSPIEHLISLRHSLVRNGILVLETLVLEDGVDRVLVPEGRYAKMRNVWFIPCISLLKTWLQRAGFTDVTVVDVTQTTTDEQRKTDWMTFESLPDFLDSDDASRTIEGYPAPVRAMLTARARH